MITITKKAASEIKPLIEKRGKGFGLRVKLTKAGCSRIYDVFFDKGKTADRKLKLDGINVFVDKETHKLLEPATIDFFQETIASGFYVDNPKFRMNMHFDIL